MELIVRPVERSDIPGMAALRALEWQTEEYWIERIGLYLSGEHSPKQGLPSRAAFVAKEDDQLVGFVAGHLTRRFGCDGELEWVNVAPDRRGLGIADKLVARMGEWFVEQGARRICVDVAPENHAARKLYARCGAQVLNKHWMVWDDARVMG